MKILNRKNKNIQNPYDKLNNEMLFLIKNICEVLKSNLSQYLTGLNTNLTITQNTLLEINNLTENRPILKKYLPTAFFEKINLVLRELVVIKLDIKIEILNQQIEIINRTIEKNNQIK